MLICGIDFETTGLSPRDDRIIEVGAVLYDWDADTPVQVLSALVNPSMPIPAEATAVNGITQKMVEDFGRPEDLVFHELHAMMALCDYAMAHNGTTFDKLFFEAAADRWAHLSLGTVWLDTKTDIKFPESITTRNLRHLAAEHNFLNPFAHRAVFDVLTMLRVARCYPIDSIVSRAREPMVYVQAIVSFDEKEKAKGRGYYWHGPSKTWWRGFKESDYLADKDICGFRTSILPGPLDK